MALFLLFESASGYALFEVTEADELGTTADSVQVNHRTRTVPSPPPPHTTTALRAPPHRTEFLSALGASVAGLL